MSAERIVLSVHKDKHGVDGGSFLVASVENGTGDMALLLTADVRPGEPWAVAQRLAACWNACAQISTEELEAVQESGGMLGPRADIVAIAKQRDELLKALKGLADLYAQTWDRSDGALVMLGSSVERFEKAHAEASAAIAKAMA